MKTCFVICPLGQPSSEIREQSDKLLDLIIKPVVKPMSYEVLRADLAKDALTIPDSISLHIFKDDLVIADLIDCNPNVFYELGKRHAWGGKCVHLTNNISQLPFDVRHHRVIQYDLSDAISLENVRQELRVNIQALEHTPLQCPFPLGPEDIIRLSGCTVLVKRVSGRRDHYYLARELSDKECTRMFLMQRSSSLILGPEQGWGAEELFYHSVLSKIEQGVEFFHIVSLEGIARHLERPHSTFPLVPQALDRLKDERGLVAIEGKKSLWYLKKIPDVEADVDMKPDRQARVFLVQLIDGNTEGVLVFDLGGKQSAFHLRGPDVKKYMDECVDFYHGCDYLRWDELNQVLKRN